MDWIENDGNNTTPDLNCTSNLTDLNTIIAITVTRTTTEIVLCAAALFILLFLGVFGNLAVILSVLLTPKLWEQPSNLYVLNLAITDLINGLSVILFAFISVVCDFQSNVNGKWCNLICMVNYCCIIVSMLTLSFIGVDRYFAVIKPLRYIAVVTKGKIFISICYTWLQGLAFAVPPTLVNWVKYDYWEAVCAITWHVDQGTDYYVICAFILCFVVPGIIMLYCYIPVIKMAWMTSKQQARVVGRIAKIYDKESNQEPDSSTAQNEQSELNRTSTQSLYSVEQNKLSCISNEHIAIPNINVRNTDATGNVTKLSRKDNKINPHQAITKLNQQENICTAKLDDSGVNTLYSAKVSLEEHKTITSIPISQVTNNHSTNPTVAETDANHLHQHIHPHSIATNLLKLSERTVSPSSLSMSQMQSNTKEKLQPIPKYSLQIVTSLIVVVITFFICVTPFCVTKLIKVIVNDVDYVPSYVNFTASCFAYLGSVVNPFIYAILRKDYRQAFTKLLRKIKIDVSNSIISSRA